MKKRWLSLLLVLALVLTALSVCAAAANADTAEDVTQDAAQTTENPDAADAADTEEETAADPQDAEAETDTEETAETDGTQEAEDVQEAEDGHTHAVNGEDACEIADFAPLDVTGGVLESGCYYLTQDTQLDAPLRVGKNGENVTLCLNGHTLSLAEGVEGCVIYVAVSDKDADPSTLTITDCNGADSSCNYYIDADGSLVFDDESYAWQEAYIAAQEKNALTGGRITGATAGAVSVGDYNKLYLHHVNIIDNAGRYGAGVVIAQNAAAVMDSCIVAGNRVTGELTEAERQIAGGVYCAGTLELAGTTNITGNRAGDAQSNLWLDETGSLTIGKQGLDQDARISVTQETGETLLSGYSDDFSENFCSDDRTRTVTAAQENGFTNLSLQGAAYTLTLDVGGEEPVTLEAEQGKSLTELNVQAPEREGCTFEGWYTADDEPVDADAPLHLTADTAFHAVWTEQEADDAAAALQFDPEKPLTREEAAKTLYQMATQLGLDTSGKDAVDLAEFDDADAVSPDAAEAVRWVYAADLLTEKDGRIRAQDTLSEKELTRMLEDFLALTAD